MWEGNEDGRTTLELAFFSIYITAGVKQKQRLFFRNATKISLSTSFEVLPFGSQSPNCKSLGESCTSSGVLRWPLCGTLTPSSLPLRTSPATPLAHCALQSEVNEQQIFHVFCLERKAQAATHSSSLQLGKQCKPQLLRCPQKSGYFAKHKRNCNRDLQLS